LIVDGRTVAPGGTLTSDVCIVGSGPAGLSLALSLARAPRLRVNVLESGGLGFDEQRQELARGEMVGTACFPLYESRIRALGGSSLSWGGICTPLEPIVFSDRPWVSPDGWPFPQSELDPFFDEALSLCGISPHTARGIDQSTDGLAQRFDIDANRAEVDPVYFSPPTRFGTDYRERIASSTNLSVFLNSTVSKLTIADEGIRVERVQVRCADGREFGANARYVVLAAGGVENPRLLLASNDAHERGLANGAGLVGRYFMEHPRVSNRYRVQPGDTPLGLLLASAPTPTRFLRLSLAPRIQREEALLGAHANLELGYACQLSSQWEAARCLKAAMRRPWKDAPFFHDKGGGRTRVRRQDVLTLLRRPDRSLVSVLGEATRWPALRRFLQVFTAVEQAPDRNNRVELLRERDALGIPKVRVRWSVSAAEERTYRRSLEIMLGELERIEPGIARARIEPDDAWPARLVGTWHHLGTTRMHPDPRRGVVDADSRVHGLENLFVAGGSVFPTAGSAAPTLTIVQLALRLGAYLSGLLI
jgi:choline dehydrogenase-like flavoprotein